MWLARHLGRRLGRRGHCRQDGAGPGDEPVGSGKSRILVRADETRPTAYRGGGGGHGVIGEAAGDAHHHGVGRPLGDNSHSPGGQGFEHPVGREHHGT